jgi:LysM repeat protein
MKFSFSSLSFGSLVLMLGSVVVSSMLSSCSSGGRVADTGYGPFDSRGNYVEAWADNPSKWNRRSIAKDSSPVEDPAPELLASNDSPPSNLTPITTTTSSRQVEVARMKPSTTTAKTTANTTSKPKSTSTASTSSKPKSSSSVAKTSSKSKAVAAKSRSTRVVVKKGDTLSGLAARYGSSVSTIQKANGMRDTKLAIGRSLVIPRL